MPELWTLLEVNICLILASVPGVKPFAKHLTTVELRRRISNSLRTISQLPGIRRSNDRHETLASETPTQDLETNPDYQHITNQLKPSVCTSEDPAESEKHDSSYSGKSDNSDKNATETLLVPQDNALQR